MSFGGQAIFNRASPTSYPRCVSTIVADYVSSGGGRVLDIGGTQRGFRARAQLPAGGSVYIANPERGVGADIDYVANIPPNTPKFDLAMMFGVMMYIEAGALLELMRDTRQRLRGGGTLLVADPDPERFWGAWDVRTKQPVAALRTRLGQPVRFHPHTRREVTEMLKKAGFTQFRDRDDLVPGFRDSFPLPPPVPRYFILAASV